jgi:hypothetical protein
MKHRVRNLDYFYPLTERHIETITLVQAIEGMPPAAPIFVKLDTQGTELSILQGSESLFDSYRIVGLEMESTLLARPIMKGSAKFWQACEYLEGQGFELLDVKPISGIGRNGRIKQGRKTYLNECDAVFALRRDVISLLAVEYRAGLLAFYLSYLLYDEALSLLEEDAELRNFLHQQGCDVGTLCAMIA